MKSATATRRIRRLPEDVVNRIAAGEVVCRPSAALKELLENSLDAGATSISVTVREGGLKFLQVSDDGNGIPREDLPLLCERFATSKISSYEDLEDVSTFGFRGEALASMSHVSRLTVLTKTRDSSVAFKVSYLSGSMRGPPEATAGVNGTTVTLEEMFYNLPTRRRALKSSSDEYRLVLDVVTRYAIHYPQVAFVCRRQQSGSASRISSHSDFRTEMSSSVADNIRTAFGSGLSHETLSFEVVVDKADTCASAVVSTANYSAKKGTFILFVNGRLVECQPLRRAVWAIYSSFLPKNSFPFVYMALKMKQSNLDVNVHPTKKEVRFLHQTLIIDAFVEELHQKLKGTETSRTFLAQSVITLDRREEQLTAVSQSEAVRDDRYDPRKSDVKDNDCDAANGAGPSKAGRDIDVLATKGPLSRSDQQRLLVDRSNDLDFTDEAEFAIGDEAVETDVPTTKRVKQSFFKSLGASGLTSARPLSTGNIVRPKDKIRTGASTPVGLYDVFLAQNIEHGAAMDIQSRRRRRSSAMPLLTSVENLLREVRQACHKGLSQMLKEHLFVGLASTKYALLQHGTKLLLANIDRLLVELMYEQVLMKFADHDMFSLIPPAPVSCLLKCYISNIPESAVQAKVDPESCITALIERAGMLFEYFGMRFQGNSPDTFVLEQLPLLFPGVFPDIKLLGRFLYHLAVDTNWSIEESCFRDLSLQIANWYGTGWGMVPNKKSVQKGLAEDAKCEHSDVVRNKAAESIAGGRKHREWVLRHVLFAAMRSDFYPPRRFFTEEVLRELTSTSRLYKVFERC